MGTVPLPESGRGQGWGETSLCEARSIVVPPRSIQALQQRGVPPLGEAVDVLVGTDHENDAQPLVVDDHVDSAICPTAPEAEFK